MIGRDVKTCAELSLEDLARQRARTVDVGPAPGWPERQVRPALPAGVAADADQLSSWLSIALAQIFPLEVEAEAQIGADRFWVTATLAPP